MPIAQEATIQIAYCDLMEELKERHAAVDFIVENTKRGVFILSPLIVGEVCFLQLRMICELIALGCLLIHGDIPATRTKKMQKAYAADWIIDRLEELHPSFYPKPGEQVHDSSGKVIELKDKTTPYLTKAELLRLYTSCGDKLHRGNLKNITGSRKFDFAQMTIWLDKIRELLNHHQIPLVDGEHQIWVIMFGKDDGKVHSHVMRRVAGPPS